MSAAITASSQPTNSPCPTRWAAVRLLQTSSGLPSSAIDQTFHVRGSCSRLGSMAAVAPNGMPPSVTSTRQTKCRLQFSPIAGDGIHARSPQRQVSVITTTCRYATRCPMTRRSRSTLRMRAYRPPGRMALPAAKACSCAMSARVLALLALCS